ncbi:hypothetical protein LTR85_001630 [Meristemomyces frigidus]|nr:hypothetical protein LTR85_001630 [Meristemomyces frigidus]
MSSLLYLIDWTIIPQMSIFPHRDRNMISPTSLLGLPAELRNRIYMLALLESDAVTINKNNYIQPGLLRTCRQVRSESSGLYYTLNTFRIDVTDCDFRADRTFKQHAAKFKAKMQLTGQAGRSSWGNLVKACKVCHEGRGTGVKYATNTSIGWRYAGRAFELVVVLKKVPWVQVEAALEALKATMATSGGETWCFD